jgi:hypothetical protein
MTETRADVYTRITNEIIAAIEAGAGAWKMPWHHDGSSIARPVNILSNKGYRGINTLALWIAAHARGYGSGTWGTYRQWAERGAQVRKGEKAASVVFWKQIRGKADGDGDAGSEMEENDGPRFVARGYVVFNRAQVEGVIEPDAPRLSWRETGSQVMCEALDVSLSGFHAWLNRTPSVRSRYDEVLRVEIGKSFRSSDRTYGARRVWHDVLAEGFSCGPHRIERLMRQNGQRARPRRRGLPKDTGERVRAKIGRRWHDFTPPVTNASGSYWTRLRSSLRWP